MTDRHRGRLEVVHVYEEDTAKMEAIHELVIAACKVDGIEPPPDSLHSVLLAAECWAHSVLPDDGEDEDEHEDAITH